MLTLSLPDPGCSRASHHLCPSAMYETFMWNWSKIAEGITQHTTATQLHLDFLLLQFYIHRKGSKPIKSHLCLLSLTEIWSQAGGDLKGNQISQGHDQQSGKANCPTWRADVQNCHLRTPLPNSLQFRMLHWLGGGGGREQSLPISMTAFRLSPA